MIIHNRKEYYKRWYKNNIKREQHKRRQYARDHKEEGLLRSLIWQKEHPTRIREIQIRCKNNNSERWKERYRRYYLKNKEKLKEKRRMSYDKYKERINETQRIYRLDPHKKIRQNISSQINKRLKQRLSGKNGKSIIDFLPYTIEELMNHLEKLFENWMNWNNYGLGRGKWNIEHIRPDSSFNYKSVNDEEFQRCWALDNLRPLETIENLKKSNKPL